jgi:hypothetical protein
MIEQLKCHVEILAAPGERVVGGAGHQKAVNYLVGEIQKIGLEPYQSNEYRLPYSVDGVNFLNIGARIPGTNPTADGAILLGVHYDTCGKQPGADDNAAAIAIYLEIAKVLKKTPLRHNVEVLFFDAEEPPYFQTDAMGSVHYYYHQRREETALALIPDLIGHSIPVTGMENMLLIQGMESHPELSGILRECENRKNLPLLACANDYMPNLSDHYAFDQNRPFLFFTCGFWEHYHEKTDTPDKLNYEKMETIALFFLDLVRIADMRDFGTGYKLAETLETELYFFNSNLPDNIKGLSGLDTLNTKTEVEKFVLETFLPLMLLNYSHY